MPFVCHAVGLLILLKLWTVFTFFQQLMTKGLCVIYTYTCSPRFPIDVIGIVSYLHITCVPMFSIHVVVSAPDDPCIC